MTDEQCECKVKEYDNGEYRCMICYDQFVRLKDVDFEQAEEQQPVEKPTNED